MLDILRIRFPLGQQANVLPQITLELAHALTQQGKRVAVMDIDSQGTMSQIIYDVKLGDDDDAEDIAPGDIRDYQYISATTYGLNTRGINIAPAKQSPSPAAQVCSRYCVVHM